MANASEDIQNLPDSKVVGNPVLEKIKIKNDPQFLLGFKDFDFVAILGNFDPKGKLHSNLKIENNEFSNLTFAKKDSTGLTVEPDASMREKFMTKLKLVLKEMNIDLEECKDKLFDLLKNHQDQDKVVNPEEFKELVINEVAPAADAAPAAASAADGAGPGFGLVLSVLKPVGGKNLEEELTETAAHQFRQAG